jgi:hypothetical protein
MPIVQFDDFPEDEKADFQKVCEKLGLDPATLVVTAKREDFQMGGGLYRIDRTVYVRREAIGDRQAVSIDLDGASWTAELEAKGRVLK